MAREEILKRISENILNPDNYLNLADTYLDTDPDLAYLSLEKAVFFEKSEDRKSQIRMLMEGLKSEGVITVTPVSIILLCTYDHEYTKNCIDSIRRNCCPGSYEIVIVVSGSEEKLHWLNDQDDIKIIHGWENTDHAKAFNVGIEKAEKGNDIMLLSNDSVMLVNSLYCLRMAIYSNIKTGAAGPMSNNATDAQKAPGMDDLEECIRYSFTNNIPIENYERRPFLAGSTLLIRHDIVEEIGLLDESFTSDLFWDNDYCYRILESSHHVLLCHNCLTVNLIGKKNRIRQERFDELYEANLSRLNKKWGFNTEYYVNTRNDLIAFIEQDHPDHDDEFCVLECGCGMGSTLLRIKYLYPNAKVHGIELMDEPARLACSSTDVIKGNVEALDLLGIYEPQDYIVFGDVIEHLVDPFGVVEKCWNVLNKGGQILASIPNIMHYSVIIPLLKGYFHFDKEGIRDYTHLHNWTYDNICYMFLKYGYDIKEMRYIVIDDGNWMESVSEEDKEWVSMMIESDSTAPEYQFRAYQYLVRACKAEVEA